MVKITVIGGSGYTGMELLRILGGHPYAEVKHIISKNNAGKYVCEVYPNLFKYNDAKFKDLDVEAVAADSDVVFSALPHSASAEICGQLAKKGVKVIDLSADFRYGDVEVYQKQYNVTHPYPELCKTAVYGLTEIYRDKIKNAALVGNPGCYTTCSILPLYPLFKEGLVSADGVIIDAKSGVSGAGRKADVGFSFAEVNENFKAYSLTTHRHTSEIECQLSAAAGKEVALSFNPHLLPIQRGILSTIYCDLNGASGDGIYQCLDKYYGKEYFVKINKEGALPEIKHIKNTNFISIGFVTDKRLNKLIIVSALDNLVKGASGQAVQNMNVMFGLNEQCGLENLSPYI